MRTINKTLLENYDDMEDEQRESLQSYIWDMESREIQIIVHNPNGDVVEVI